ncbi:MAG: NAD(P)H-hydrate dehydratase [Lachnospiraceae bacterium]|nr:NAD(P)H-hydrate dehydratase [Lachnospiraceae bacterium]
MRECMLAAEMQSADQYTQETLGLSATLLMERAALAVADVIEQKTKDCDHKLKVAVLCGNGNNGGDGLALGRILTERGCFVRFFMEKDPENASESNLYQRKVLTNAGYDSKFSYAFDETVVSQNFDVYVDALFGIGLKRNIVGNVAEWIRVVNRMPGLKVAVDIPSGVNTDTGEVMGVGFLADITVSFASAKRGHVLYPGRSYCGEVLIRKIGVEGESCGFTYTKEDAKKLLPKRFDSSNKGSYGKAGIIAGSAQTCGAAMLSVLGAFTMGPGYVKLLSDAQNRNPLMYHAPEALFYAYKGIPEDEKEEGDADLLAASLLPFKDCNAIAVGPGLGTGKAQEEFLMTIFEQVNVSTVLDADALTMVSENIKCKEALREFVKRLAKDDKYVIMTPHKREFAKLTGLSEKTSFRELLEVAAAYAEQYGVILVLKDACTMIFYPDGGCYMNQSGNPGMSTAGSGDVLTGMMVGLLAQMDAKQAASLAVYLHGLSGDAAANALSMHAMRASDIAKYASCVISELEK